MRILFKGMVVGLAVAGVAATAAVGWGYTDRAARSDRLTAESTAAQARTAEKRAVAAALADGQLTVAQAADRFAGLLAEEPVVLDRLRAQKPGATDQELALRQVATFLGRVAEERTGPTADRARGLEADILADLGPSPVAGTKSAG